MGAIPIFLTLNGLVSLVCVCLRVCVRACARARARVTVCACVCVQVLLFLMLNGLVGTIGSDLLWPVGPRGLVSPHPSPPPHPPQCPYPYPSSPALSRHRLSRPPFAFINLSNFGSTLSCPLARAGFRKPGPAAPLFE